MSHFFIDRPIFAWVLAIIVMLAGVVSIVNLPVAQYPSIAPPSVRVMSIYPGASAQVVDDTVTQVIEQRMTGLDGLAYMSSKSESTGTSTIVLTFDSDVDPDIAQVQVQNKLQLAMPLLPQEVQAQGVLVVKSISNFLMALGFVSTDGSMTNEELGDYASSYIQDGLSRVHGVGEVILFASPMSMRIWLDPDKLMSYGLTPADVRAAIRAQNAQVSAGQLGGLPSVEDQRINFTVMVQERLQTPEQFRKILLRTNPDGSAVRLGDVARVDLDPENSIIKSRFNGEPAAGMAISLTSDANAMDTARAVWAYIDSIKPTFPAGFQVVEPFDTTPFVRASIMEVVRTLAEAVLLVFLVMYLFLQNIRATIIPTIAIPVVLLGTFAMLSIFGFTINTLTMFAMVLAIGLLVDDAIIVVENVERIMHEDGLSPREATRQSMTQITGALVGVTMVLAVVFLPMALFPGSTGVIYRQFSITIATAMGLSLMVALILTPALCASLLKPMDHSRKRTKGFFAWFNRSFERLSSGYQGMVGHLVRRLGRSLLAYALILGGLYFLFMRLPTGFLPEEDMGTVMLQVQMPVGSTQASTLEVVKRVEDYFHANEADNLQSIMTIVGYSFSGGGQNTAMGFVRLKDWSRRKEPAQKAAAVVERAMAEFSQYKDSMVFAFTPPPIPELGQASGFDFELQDMGGLGHDKLMAAQNQLLAMAAQHPDLVMVRSNGLADTPQYRIDIDWEKVGALGIPIAEVNDVISTAWGSSYVNDFLDKGRVKKVIMQGDAPFRMMPGDLRQWHVRNAAGQMVPMSSIASSRWTTGSPRLERYNGVPARQILGMAAPGKSSGQAMATMEELAGRLEEGIGFSWTGLSYQERQAGAQAGLLYALSILVVFLCLAALYESWSLPTAVIMAIPLGIVGAVLGMTLRGMSNDVYFQVGLLATIGLAAKNAILIVEFAKALHESGMELLAAAVEAARQRLRPIIMTSLAFGLGVLPLAVSSGAGSGGQNAIGTGVVSGTLASTIIGPLLIPAFFVLVVRLGSLRKRTGTTSRVIIPGGRPCED